MNTPRFSRQSLSRYLLIGLAILIVTLSGIVWLTQSSIERIYISELKPHIISKVDSTTPTELALVRSLEKELNKVILNISLIALVGVLVVVLLSFSFYRNVHAPLSLIRENARQYAQGNFEYRLPKFRLHEFDALAQAMNTMTKQLKQLEQVRRDFVANVSHELRTPITSIRGFVEILAEGGMQNEEEAKRFLEIVLRQSDRLMHIVEDLLTLSRLEGRPSQFLIKENELLSDILKDCVEACLPQAEKKNIRLTFNCHSSITLNVDRALVEQAIYNLVDNAIKYSGQGKSVELIGEMTSDGVRVIVKDTGPGIAEGHLDRIFERFYRIDKARSRDIGGTGLGLSIVKHVMSAHNGAVSVKSKLGEGTAFELLFPLVEQNQT